MTRFRRPTRRGAIQTAVVLVFAAAVTTISVVVIRADNEHPVVYGDVCKAQGHDGALYSDPLNPYSWFCYDTSNTAPRVVAAGGLKIWEWCIEEYGDSVTKIVSWNIQGWRCVDADT